MPLPNNSNLPPGVSYNDIDPPEPYCSSCNARTEYVCAVCKKPLCDRCEEQDICVDCRYERMKDE